MPDQSVTPEQIDAPGPLAELTAAFEAYERALMANDVAALDAMFRQSPLTLRSGIEEIARFRRERPGGSPPRTLRRTRITTFGASFGAAGWTGTICKRRQAGWSGAAVAPRSAD